MLFVAPNRYPYIVFVVQSLWHIMPQGIFDATYQPPLPRGGITNVMLAVSVLETPLQCGFIAYAGSRVVKRLKHRIEKLSCSVWLVARQTGSQSTCTCSTARASQGGDEQSWSTKLSRYPGSGVEG